MMGKNYFTDEQIVNIAIDAGFNEPYAEVMLKDLKSLMNLAVETAIGDAVGNVFINKDIVGVAFHSPLNQVKDNQLLYTVQELDN